MLKVTALPLLRFARREPLLLALVAGTWLAYAALSFLEHVNLSTSSYDLGIFDQAVWQYSRLEWAESSVRGVSNLLGDHFHPILMALAPLYWVWDDPRMLLGAQAGLLAVSVVPVFLYSQPRIGRPAAHMLALAYCLFWGVQSAMISDFHEIAFVPPLIAFAIWFADVRRWRGCFISLALLLLVKEDVALLVASFGVYLVVLRHRRQGLAVLGAGLVWFALVMKLAIPAFADGRPYGYWRYGPIGDSVPDAVGNVVRSPWLPFQVLFDAGEKVRTLGYLLAPFLGLILVSPLVILALPLIAERMYSTQTSLWETGAHYSLAVAPILAMGAADGLQRVLGVLGRRHRLAAIAPAAVALMLAVALVPPDGFFLGRLADPDRWSADGRERAAARAFQRVPEHEGSVAAASRFVPHLSRRSRIYELPRQPAAPETDYIVYEPAAISPLERRHVNHRRSRYSTIFAERGIRVLRLRRLAASGASRRVLPEPPARG